MRAFNVKEKLGMILMTKKDKIKLYQRDVDAGQGVAKLFANTEHWLTVQSILQKIHDEAVKKLSHRRLPSEDLEWANNRIATITEIFDEFKLINNKGIVAQNKLKELKDG